MKLHELHVLQRDTSAPGHRHAVAGAGIGVGGAAVDPPQPAGGEHHRAGLDALNAAVQQVPGGDADTALAVGHQVEREPLLVHGDAALDQLLVEHVQQHVAGDVSGVAGARRAARAERALGDAAVLGAREDRAHVLELVDVARALGAHHRDRVLVAQVVGALDGEEGVVLGAVFAGVSERGVDAALGRAGVAAGGMQLGDDTDVGAIPGRLDRSAHARKPRADHHHVVSNHSTSAKYRAIGAQKQPTKRGHGSPQLDFVTQPSRASSHRFWGRLARRSWVRRNRLTGEIPWRRWCLHCPRRAACCATSRSRSCTRWPLQQATARLTDYGAVNVHTRGAGTLQGVHLHRLRRA